MSKSFFDGVLEPEKAAKPKFFGEGGTGRAVAGYLGDYLYRMGGGGGSPYQETIEGRRQQESILARAIQESQLRRDQYDYERANPKPVAPHYWEQNDGSLGVVDAAGPRTLYKDPTPKIDWLQVKDPATGAVSLVPRPQGGAAAAPPPGVTFKPRAGGASPSGSRTFPVR